MSMSASLQFRQSQSLTMTPQLMQSIRLLQFTPLELTQFIESQVQVNPLLELVGHDNTPAAQNPLSDASNVVSIDASHSDIRSADNAANGQQNAVRTGDERQAGDLKIGEMGQSLDVNYENVYPDDHSAGQSSASDTSDTWRQTSDAQQQNSAMSFSGGEGFSGEEFDLDSFAAKGPGLKEFVHEQIAHYFNNLQDRIIATNLADYLDDAGYLDIELADIADKLGISLSRTEAVLEGLQSFDPPGIFARGLSECLKLQLLRKDRFDPAMAALVDHLDHLARRDFKSLCKICGVNESDLSDMISEIRALDPKPGTQFDTTSTQTIVPDVMVTLGSDGAWQIEMNPETLPRVLVNQNYFAKVTRSIEKSSPEYDFMSECLQNANWLARSLDQRVKTIIKVTSEIIRQQDEFFTHGVSHLKPLNLKSVADEIGMHESTVSRVTSNKYMMTPQGLFELKFFFSVSIAGSDQSDAHSAEAVRHRIKELISAECVKTVLSDDDIVKKLKAQNIDIARRTIAKYRESMNIPSSVQRRREKKMQAKQMGQNKASIAAAGRVENHQDLLRSPA